MRLLTRFVVVATVAGGLVVTMPALAPPAFADSCFDVNARDAEKDPVDRQGTPIESLQIAAAQDLVARPGGGVRVAVVDSGVADPPVAVAERLPAYEPSPDLDPLQIFYQGTAVAGLIGGARQGDQIVGIAPDAELVDIQVYDAADGEDDDSDDSTELEMANLVRGLERAAAANVDIVNVSLEIEPSPQLRRAVRNLTRRGVIVVAASGDVPLEGERFEDEFGTARSGDDAAQEIFPAGYAVSDPLVVAATSTVADGTDPGTLLLPSSATTVAVPTAGGVSYAVNGERCDLEEPSSVYAAATVTGVLALLQSKFPRESPRQLIARLTDTAAGPATPSGPIANRFLGHGVVQPLEALTRVVDPAPDGEVERLAQPESSNEPAAIDPPDPDLLASAREDAVWWALGTGGLIAVLLLLRPVIGRRRRETDPRT